MYVCGQSLSSSFPLISPSFFEVVEGERHYFMYASICYFCKNENRKKTFTSNTWEKPTWSRMIITGAKFKQGNFRTSSTLNHRQTSRWSQTVSNWTKRASFYLLKLQNYKKNRQNTTVLRVTLLTTLISREILGKYLIFRIFLYFSKKLFSRFLAQKFKSRYF